MSCSISSLGFSGMRTAKCSNKEVHELKASLDTIRRAASDLIVKIDEKSQNLHRGRRIEDPAESKEDNTPDSKQDEKDKPEKKKSVKKQISDKKEKAAKTAKPKKVDTKNLGEAI